MAEKFDLIAKAIATILKAIKGGVVGRFVTFLMVGSVAIALICRGVANAWVSALGILSIVAVALILGLRLLKLVEKNTAAAILDPDEFLKHFRIASKYSPNLPDAPADRIQITTLSPIPKKEDIDRPDEPEVEVHNA